MAWNPYPNNYPVGGYNPAQNYIQPSYNPVGQQAGYMNAPVQPQQPVQTAVTQPVVAIQGRMVTSREEALGVPADFLGNPLFMPDISHGVIYSKVLDVNTGAAKFFEYKLVENPSATAEVKESAPQVAFASKEDFESVSNTISDMQDTLDSLRADVDRLKKPTSRK